MKFNLELHNGGAKRVFHRVYDVRSGETNITFTLASGVMVTYERNTFDEIHLIPVGEEIR